MKYNSIEDFRTKADEKELYNLETFIKAQRNKSEAFPNEYYHFSYTSASKYLREKGYLGGVKTRDVSTESRKFVIYGDKRTNFVNRTFTVDKDLLDRMDKLAADNWQYSKKAIYNQLIDIALKIYGY